MRRWLAVGAALVLLAWAGVLGGCASGNAVATKVYVLNPLAAEAGGGAARGGGTIGVGPISLPGYLDRAQIVTRAGAGDLELAEAARWGEPLRDNVGRVLAENLAALIPSDRVVLFPWRAGTSVQHRIVVDMTRFDGPLGGPISLEARWRILDAQGRELALRTARLTEPTGASGYPTLVAAMDRALAALSRAIAQEVRSLPR